MKFTAVLAGLLAAAIFMVSGNHAYAQSQTGHTTKKPIVQKPVMVTVAQGDTLTAIAAANQSTYVRVFDANTNVSDPNLIYPGDSLRIPNATEQLTDRPLPADATPDTTGASVAIQSAPATQPALTQQPAIVQSGPVSGCGDNAYANFIYSHESGCRTTAMSPNGCYGIGQACPASKIAYCGADYACQNAFFTAYAAKYGGWAGAYGFWVAHGWW